MRDFPSPFALARQLTPWDNETLQDAASLVASYSPKGVRAAEASPDGIMRDVGMYFLTAEDWKEGGPHHG